MSDSDTEGEEPSTSDSEESVAVHGDDSEGLESVNGSGSEDTAEDGGSGEEEEEEERLGSRPGSVSSKESALSGLPKQSVNSSLDSSDSDSESDLVSSESNSASASEKSNTTVAAALASNKILNWPKSATSNKHRNISADPFSLVSSAHLGLEQQKIWYGGRRSAPASDRAVTGRVSRCTPKHNSSTPRVENPPTYRLKSNSSSPKSTFESETESESGLGSGRSRESSIEIRRSKSSRSSSASSSGSASGDESVSNISDSSAGSGKSRSASGPSSPDPPISMSSTTNGCQSSSARIPPVNDSYSDSELTEDSGGSAHFGRPPNGRKLTYHPLEPCLDYWNLDSGLEGSVGIGVRDSISQVSRPSSGSTSPALSQGSRSASGSGSPDSGSDEGPLSEASVLSIARELERSSLPESPNSRRLLYSAASPGFPRGFTGPSDEEADSSGSGSGSPKRSRGVLSPRFSPMVAGSDEPPESDASSEDSGSESDPGAGSFPNSGTNSYPSSEAEDSIRATAENPKGSTTTVFENKQFSSDSDSEYELESEIESEEETLENAEPELGTEPESVKHPEPAVPSSPAKKGRRGPRCLRCKRMHTKCDGNIPCQRCIIKGTVRECFPGGIGPGGKPRLRCTMCTKRHLSCDKEIPCQKCIRAGLQDQCNPGESEEKGVSVRKAKSCQRCIRMNRQCTGGNPCLSCKGAGLQDQCSFQATPKKYGEPAEPTGPMPYRCQRCAKLHECCSRETPCRRCIDAGLGKCCSYATKPQRIVEQRKKRLRVRCQRCIIRHRPCDKKTPCHECEKAGLRDQCLYEIRPNEFAFKTSNPEPTCQRCIQFHFECDGETPCQECRDANISADKCVYKSNPDVPGPRCQFCIRRHIKCDRKCPCNQCITHGKADQCTLDDGTEFAKQQAGVLLAKEPKRDKIGFNEGYRKLLNHEIHMSSARQIYELENAQPLRSSYILGSQWESAEKDKFFNILATAGKDDLPTISKAVGTKSVVECRAYLMALQEGLVEAQKQPLKNKLLTLKDMPAAVELSGACVKALEEAAEAIEEAKQNDEAKAERAKWDEFWLLKSETAHYIEDLLATDDIEYQDIAPEAELLKIGTMLELSKSIFMSGPDNKNWKKWSRGTPSIRYTAFSDFHTLVISLTRRIIQTTLFIANSRIRNHKRMGVARSLDESNTSEVFAFDVEAAINTLDLPLNTVEYWAKLPRMAGIFVSRYARGKGGTVPYDEVETLFGIDIRKSIKDSEDIEDGDDEDSEFSTQTSDDGEKTDSPNPTSEEDDGDSSSASSSFYSFFPDEPHRRDASKKKQDANAKLLEKQEDAYIESLDRKNALKAEKHLWSLLNLPERFEKIHGKSNAKDEDSFPPSPRPKIAMFKRKADLLDWRDETEYHADWERFPKKRRFGEGENTPSLQDVGGVGKPSLELEAVLGRAGTSRGGDI